LATFEYVNGNPEKKRNLGNLLEGVNAPRCARGRKPTRKYLFGRFCRRGRGRGTHKKAHVENAGL